MVHGESRNADWETEPSYRLLRGRPGLGDGYQLSTLCHGSRVTEHITWGPRTSLSLGNIRNTKEDWPTPLRAWSGAVTPQFRTKAPRHRKGS